MFTRQTVAPSHRVRRPRRRAREGAAVVELALILPVMLILIFGTLEVCQRLILRETAAVAAYETARLAARRNVSAERAIERGQSVLEGRRISGGGVDLTPDDLTGIPTGSELEVTVTVPVVSNTTVSYVLPLAGEITVVATMLRE